MLVYCQPLNYLEFRGWSEVRKSQIQSSFVFISTKSIGDSSKVMGGRQKKNKEQVQIDLPPHNTTPFSRTCIPHPFLSFHSN